MPRMADSEQNNVSLLSFGSLRPERAYVPLRRDDGQRDRPLLGLAGSSVGERFRSWTGRSGRRYIFSVYPAGQLLSGNVPVDGAAVVVAAQAGPGGVRQVLWVGETGSAPESFFRSDRFIALAARAGCELHLHLLASEAHERRAIVADLGA